MQSLDLFLDFLTGSSVISIIVLIWLSIYFIITVWVYVARNLILKSMIKVETDSLQSLLMGTTKVRRDSVLSKCISSYDGSENRLNICKSVAEKNATSALAMLSIISSTSPFIGLFGTIVSILETFSELGKTTSASLNVIAPAISEALIATAAGIFVAIPAYSAHILLKRKGYNLITIVQREIDLLLSKKEDSYTGSEKYEF